MTRNEIKAVEEIKIKRIIGQIQGKEDGPTLIFFGGIHGNEPSGVKALEHVFHELEVSNQKPKGAMYGIIGNIPALLKEKRFLEQDLNRIWTLEGIEEINNKKEEDLSVEEKELKELYQIISEILVTQSPPFYFIDFHTTSSRTLPFITINDAMINRKFSRLFPVPVILGIEEFLEGPLLSYINKKGYVSLGFESGQHYKDEAVQNSIAFIWLTLIYAGLLEKDEVLEHPVYYRQLKSSAKGNKIFYEVIHRHRITADDDFEMLSDIQSFDPVNKGTSFAEHNGEKIEAYKDTIVFMPLYQEQGEEGFFLVREIPQWILKFSAFLRRIKLENLLHVLPGISWANPEKDRLLVNLKVARFYSKPFFHLLGYRSKVLDKTHIVMNNRERAAKNQMYRNAWWYRK